MARRKRKNRSDNPFDETRDESASQSRQSTKKSNRPRRWLYVLLFLILLIGLLPNIVGWTGLHQTAIHFALSDFKGSVKVGSVSLGWFQPISLTNISALDASGNDLLKVDRVTSSQPLYSFLTGSDYGIVNVSQPTIYLQLRPDGSNFEDALAEYLNPVPNNNNTKLSPPGQQSPLPKLAINITDGRALVTSSTDQQSWQIEKWSATVNTSAAAAPLALETQCQITPMQLGADGKIQLLSPGSVSIQSQFDPGETVLRLGAIDVALATENLPLSLAAPVLQRFVGPARSAGQMSGQFHSQINLNQSAMKIEVGRLNLQQLAFAAPELIGSDQINIRNLDANGSLEISPKIISSSNFQLQSDFGKLNANGRFDVNQLNALASGGALLDEPFQMDGQIDLAGLFRMLPATLKLHEDLQVDAGTVQFQAGTKNEEGTRRLVLNMDAANLKARRGGQPIVWQKPLRLVGTVVQSQGRLAIEDLLCESDFLAIAGSATPESGAFRAQGDLSKLIDRVGEFVDLAGTNLAGQIDGTFGWQTADVPANNPANIHPIQIGGSFVVENPIIQLPNMPVWKQPRLSVKMSASGQSITNPQTSEMILRLDQGGVQVEVGTERAVATLAQPLQNAYTDPMIFNCDATGSLAGWLGHVRNFVDIGDISAAGNVALNAVAALKNKHLQLTNVNYKVDQLAFNGYGMKIRDPEVTGTGEASYDLTSGTIQIADVTLVGNSLAARGQNLRVAFLENMRVDGAVAFRADVNRVADWFELSPTEASVFWFGSAEGNLQLVSNETGIGGRLTSVITDLVAAQRTSNQPVSQPVQPVSNRTEWTELFRESKTQLDSDLRLANDFNAIQFQNLVLQSSALGVHAAGSISDLAASMLTNIQGTWNPDWQKVKTLLAAYTGNLFQLSGAGSQPFSIRGPVFATATGPDSQTAWLPSQLEASTSIRWDQGSILNVPIGASQLNVEVKNSFGTVNTPGIPFSGGVVQFAPGVDMRGDNPLLVMNQTRVIDNVALTADTARQWLKYVAPLAADATSAQGNFTLDVGDVKMPIFDPLKVEAIGEIRLTNVVIGAGPLADQLIGTITQIRTLLKPEAGDKDLKTWLRMSEQSIPIQIKNQTVYHENVTFKLGDVTVVTSGAVGFDQRLQMLAEIPIADDWIAGKPYLAGLKGQKISIPIGGLVTQPQLDKRAIQSLSTQLVKQAAGSAINQAITDKVTPQLDQFQNQVNDKVGSEINKLQSKFGEKLGGQIPNLGGFLPSGSGTPQTPETGSAPNSGSAAPATSPPDVGKQLEGELIKGIGNLFGGKK